MGAINAYSGPEFPGAQTTVETSLGGDDCPLFTTFEELVSFLQGPTGAAATIRHGRAYSLGDVEDLGIFCTIP